MNLCSSIPLRTETGGWRGCGKPLSLRNGTPFFQYLPLESRIHAFQEDYYNAIAACHTAGNANAFIEFMLDKIDLTLEQAMQQASARDAYLPGTVQKLLSVMGPRCSYTTAQLMDMLGRRGQFPQTLPRSGV